MSPPASQLYVRQIPVGAMENFAYLIGAKDSPEVVVVDPAWEPDTLLAAAKEDGKVIKALFASHHHHDHINAIAPLLETLDVPVYAQQEEIDFSPALRAFGDALRPLRPGDSIQVGPASLKAIHTPGHTPGSQCLYTGDALVSGDTVFVNACGRCDFNGGDPELMFQSLHSTLGKLPASTALYPGHDYGDVKVSSLEREREKNPYFRVKDLADFVALRMRPRK